MDIILSSRNRSKVEQIREIFKDSRFNIISLDDTDIQGEAIEDGLNLLENARKKANYAFDRSSGGVWVIADDTGLFITALGGAPGIKLARWAGETASTDDITQFTLKKLEGHTDRSAVFKTTVVLVNPLGEEYVFAGKCHGTLLDYPKVPAQPDMPYSPLFVPNGLKKVWAEMTAVEENLVSHRGMAFRKAKKWLEEHTK